MTGEAGKMGKAYIMYVHQGISKECKMPMDEYKRIRKEYFFEITDTFNMEEFNRSIPTNITCECGMPLVRVY